MLGSMLGIPLGCALMYSLGQVKLTPPGGTEDVNLPVDWSWPQFAIAIGFAMIAAIIAAYLPARKASHVEPVDILRGS